MLTDKAYPSIQQGAAARMYAESAAGGRLSPPNLCETQALLVRMDKLHARLCEAQAITIRAGDNLLGPEPCEKVDTGNSIEPDPVGFLSGLNDRVSRMERCASSIIDNLVRIERVF